MENMKQEDLIEKVDPTPKSAKVDTKVETEQDPLKTELEKVQKISGRTELEKAQFSLKKNAEKVKELGGDPTTILGIDQVIEEADEDSPVTVGMLKKMQTENATKTAKQLADEIQDETERELVKFYIDNRVVPSGNPKQDLEDARGMVNAKKNAQILEEIARKNPPKSHTNSSGAPLKYEQEQPELTKEEQTLMKFGGLTKEEVLKTRK